MTNDFKADILRDFEVRKTKKQKTHFIEYVREIFGDRMKLEESGTLVKSRNIIIGDPSRAKKIFTAHYDTCARLFIPNFITPFNIPVYLIYQIIVGIVLLVIPFGLSLLATMFTNSFILTEIALFIPFLAEMYLITSGPANPHTANDNTSGVVCVLELAARLVHDPDCAFVLFDNEELGLFGSAAFAKKYPDIRKNTIVINFDCVSDGDTIVSIASKRAELTKDWAQINARASSVFSKYGKSHLPSPKRGTIYPSDQFNFKNSIAFCALKKSKCRFIGYYMDKIHTPRDTVFDKSNIDAICELFAGSEDLR